MFQVEFVIIFSLISVENIRIHDACIFCVCVSMCMCGGRGLVLVGLFWSDVCIVDY